MIARWARLPWWAQVLLIFAAARGVTTVIMMGFARGQLMNAWTGASPDYGAFATMWDSRWYNIVAFSGYPSVLPISAEGHVQQNAWAFMPVYPFTVRGLMTVTGLEWNAASLVVAIAFGFGAALLFYKLMRRVQGHGSSLFAVVLFSVAPASPVLQVGYAESMQLFFIALALYLTLERRYVALIPVVIVMSFVRPTGLAFALFLGLHVVYRWFTRRRDPFPPRQIAAAVGATAASLVAGFAWPAIAGIVTGDIHSYTQTELSWRADYIGYQELLPFTPWIQGFHWWFGPVYGTIFLVALVVAFALILFTPLVKRLGVDLRLWLASYALYLLAVFFPQSSTFRLLAPMFPLLGALAIPKNKVYRVALVVLSVAGQWVWLEWCWRVNGADWTPP